MADPAALNNSGLMALIVLASGSLYVSLGGAIPLLTLDAYSGLLLLTLVLTMQVSNDLGMLGLLVIGRRNNHGISPVVLGRPRAQRGRDGRARHTRLQGAPGRSLHLVGGRDLPFMTGSQNARLPS